MEQAETFCLTLPARYRYLQLIGDCIEALLAALPNRLEQEQAVYGVKLAVHEIANNVIEHAYGNEEGEFKITLQFDPHSQRFSAHLHDTGRAFTPATVHKPNLDEVQESGYGLFLAEQLMDEVTYQHQPDGNHWRLVKTLC